MEGSDGGREVPWEPDNGGSISCPVGWKEVVAMNDQKVKSRRPG